MEDLWVGVDISKSLVAVHIRPTNESFSCKNDVSGAEFIAVRLQQLAPKLIVLEATGGHEVLLANELVLAKLPVAVVNPAHARNFARAVGRLVKVHYGEGVANHTGPESCAAYREVCGEALTGERAGQPLSRETFLIQDADAVTYAEGKTNGCAIASTRTVLRGRRPWHARTLLAREPGDLQFDHLHRRVVRIGKARSRSR